MNNILCLDFVNGRKIHKRQGDISVVLVPCRNKFFFWNETCLEFGYGKRFTKKLIVSMWITTTKTTSNNQLSRCQNIPRDGSSPGNY